MSPPGPGAPVPDDDVARMLRGLRAVLDEASDARVWSLTEESVHSRLAEALAVRARLDQLVAQLVDQVDARGLAETHGTSSTRAYLMAAHRMSSRAAVETVSAAAAMTDRTAPTQQAWATGLVSAEQATLIASAANRLSAAIPADRVDSAQLDLVVHAQRLTFRELKMVAAHVVEVVDPDGADATLGQQLEDDEARARQQATFRASRGADGVARYSGRMPNLCLDQLTTALEAIAAPRRNLVEQAASVTQVATGADGTSFDQLPYATRMGQAFCDLVAHLPTTELPQHGVANATLVITLDEQQLRTGLGVVTLSTGDEISAGEARRLACNAGLLPAVLDGQSRVLDLGRSKRLFDRHQRLALVIRDRGCVFPGCDRPPAWTEAHHLEPWSRGGATDVGNGCLLCCFHHHLVHGTAWQVVMAADGVPEAIPPPELDPSRTPRRHHRFTPRRE